MIENFIVKDEKEFWLLKKERCENEIKEWIKRGVKVVMNNEMAVGLLGDYDLDTKQKTRVYSLAENYIFILTQLEMLEK